MLIFICPVCKGELEQESDAFRCKNGHSFDISAEGYVNLMPSGRARGNAGDNAQMMAARTQFLNHSYYACLKDALAKLSARLLCEEGEKMPLLVDAGCGEGYYTAGIAEYLRDNGIDARVSGIDISKRGVKAAAKRDRSVHFAVAGIFDLPYAGGSADLVFNIFAPLCEEEFCRVLKTGGKLVLVTPGKEHLLGLKQVLYDHPYENEEKPFDLKGFAETEKITVKENITVEGCDVEALFAMTPYFWNTPLALAQRLRGIGTLETPIDFVITVFTKQ